ncbi:nucleoside phosphorylase domain-containing protein [Macrophomina phaseolina]|uniref:Nucleoside phosphorylase domain-containing protein n=1 Tax=Macrophomina phaseolina TaxID=35725 RepID=A0ABQ8FWM2_9PEZI|nr:nucleoside phosphorylase domain-containing protein [Macrophomina phaseolina]
MSDLASYTIGWICHDSADSISEHDNNTYTLGRIGKHRVVIASLPDGEYGIASATGVARDLLHSFPNIRISLLVGIGGGAPSGKHDIRLGDIVVSFPRGGQSGILQYDYGKAIQVLGFKHSGSLNQPQPLLRTAVSDLRGRYLSNGNQIYKSIQSILTKKKRLRRLFQRPESSTNRLYRSTFVHANRNKSCSDVYSGDANKEAKAGHLERVVKRIKRSDDEDNPIVHYSLIASTNTLRKNAEIRDSFAEKHDALCFQMEAAGLMNHFPYLVIRGICDYSDTHKNEDWQGYVAVTVATYAKDLLGRIPPKRVKIEKRV